jgi:hypothetical protein
MSGEPPPSYSQFYDLSRLEEIAVNLFYGWGYNFYRLENQLRADSLMVRSKASYLLGLCRGILEIQQSDYRRKYFKPPTREHPLPSEAAMEGVETLQDLSRETGRLEGVIRAAPVPENDRMTQRYRQEAETLVRLREIDCRLVGQIEVLRQMIDGKDYDFLLEHAADVRTGFAAINESIHDRQMVLQ